MACFEKCFLPSKFHLEHPSAPQDLSVICEEPGKIILSWKPPTNDGGSPVTGYILQVAPAGSKDFSDISKVESKSLNYEVNELEEGKEYSFRIKAENVAGTSEKPCQLNKPVKIPPKISEL